jgi:phage shock protein C
MKKLYRHHENSHGTPIFSGIFSGLGEWMEVSPGILRVGYILLAIITGIIPAVLLYLMFHFLIAKKQG